MCLAFPTPSPVNPKYPTVLPLLDSRISSLMPKSFAYTYTAVILLVGSCDDGAIAVGGLSACDAERRTIAASTPACTSLSKDETHFRVQLLSRMPPRCLA